MTDGTDMPSARPVARTLKWLLGLQIGIGLLLAAGDLLDGPGDMGLPALPRFGPDAPEMDAPVRPGDQTRRFTPAAPLPEYRDLPERLAILRDGDTVTLRGGIGEGDAQRVTDDLRAAPPATVRLISPGGSVSDALAIGRAIRTVGAATVVPAGAPCLSACPYVFAGGASRTAEEDARVGVHQHYFGQSTVLPAFMAVEDVQRGQAEVMAYLQEMGIDPLLMAHAMATPPDEIYVLLPEELARYRLTTDAGDQDG